jgi:hypothetical protein
MADEQLLVNAKGWKLLGHWGLFNISTYMAMKALQSQVTENFHFRARDSNHSCMQIISHF